MSHPMQAFLPPLVCRNTQARNPRRRVDELRHFLLQCHPGHQVFHSNVVSLGGVAECHGFQAGVLLEIARVLYCSLSMEYYSQQHHHNNWISTRKKQLNFEHGCDRVQLPRLMDWSVYCPCRPSQSTKRRSVAIIFYPEVLA